MWQRFTERARRVVFFAQEEAARLGENYVGTEHLLLGLVRENDSVAARILDRLGVPLGRIRSDIERQVTRGHGNLGQDMQLTPRAKRVIGDGRPGPVTKSLIQAFHALVAAEGVEIDRSEPAGAQPSWVR